MSRRSRPTHDHIHDPDRVGEQSAVRYLEDNEYRKNSLPKSAWIEVFASADPHVCLGCGLRAYSATGIAQIAYNGTVKDGGITVSLDGQQPDRGFAHSLDVSNEIKIPLAKFTPDDVERYVQSRQGELAQPDRYLGTWISGGNVYLDVSQVKADHDEAYAGARDSQQEAMWDIAGDREIPIAENAHLDRPVIEDWYSDPVTASNPYNGYDPSRQERPDIACPGCGKKGQVGYYGPIQGDAQCRGCGKVFPIGNDMPMGQVADMTDFSDPQGLPAAPDWIQGQPIRQGKHDSAGS